jgi:hypothetical protein
VRKRFTTRRIPRRRGAATGFVLVLLGLWGALIPFVGPYFDYQIGTSSTWDWSIDRLWLSVLPGAAAVLGGLIMLYSTRRSTASFGGLLALAGGLWFIAGPSVSMLWNGGTQATGAASGDNGTRVLEWIGFYYGTGAVITLFASYGLGFLAALPVTGEAVRTGEGEEPPATAPSQPTEREEPRATAPSQPTDREEAPSTRPAPRRRGFLGRRTRRRSEPVEPR